MTARDARRKRKCRAKQSFDTQEAAWSSQWIVG